MNDVIGKELIRLFFRTKYFSHSFFPYNKSFFHDIIMIFPILSLICEKSKTERNSYLKKECPRKCKNDVNK